MPTIIAEVRAGGRTYKARHTRPLSRTSTEGALNTHPRTFLEDVSEIVRVSAALADKVPEAAPYQISAHVTGKEGPAGNLDVFVPRGHAPFTPHLVVKEIARDGRVINTREFVFELRHKILDAILHIAGRTDIWPSEAYRTVVHVREESGGLAASMERFNRGA